MKNNNCKLEITNLWVLQESAKSAESVKMSVSEKCWVSDANLQPKRKKKL